MPAYEAIPEQRLKVGFVKYTHISRLLLIAYEVITTAQWLKKTIPILKPWEVVTLAALEKKYIPNRWYDVVYVSDGDTKIEVKEDLHRAQN